MKKFYEKLEKIKQKNKNLKIKVMSIVAIFVAIVAIVAILIITRNNSSNKLNRNITDPELARAMSYGELTEEDEKTQSENVRFSAYFARDLNGDGYAEKVKGTCKEVGGEDTLYMSLSVLGDGYLKDGKIEIEGNNIYFKTALVDDETIEGNYISENTKEINLKDVQSGTQKLIFGQIRSGDYRYNTTKKDAIGKNTKKLSGVNKIKITGTHVSDNNVETKIEKEIEFPIDWYSETKAEIPYTYGSNGEKNKYQNYNTENIVDEENKEVNLEFKIVSQESNNKLLISKSSIEGTIPELNGYKATRVEITGDNVEYTYDAETGIYKASRESQIDDGGIVRKEAYTSSYNNARYSEFKLKVTYPLAAYEEVNGTIVINIPVKATFEGYNNPNEEFTNPYVSNVAEDIISVTYERGGGDVIGYDVQVGTWVPSPYYVYVVSKEKAVSYYNNDEEKEEDRYEVRWYVSRGNSGDISNVELKETEENYGDKFLTTSNTYEDMTEYSKNIGLYFVTPGAMFGEDGYIRVYNDENDKLIHEFTSKDWDKYTKESPYYYDEPVEHIRIETSKAERVSSFTAVNIKEIDNEKLTTNKSREEFNKLSKIYSYLTGYAKYNEDEDYKKLKDDIGVANYDEPLSMAQITSISPDTLSTQKTTNVKLTIGTVNLGYNVKQWQNGTFLLKFPAEVLLAEINEVNVNNGNVGILGYDIYEEDGNYYLKILTENENPETYTITVDANITPDPRKLSASRNIELYAYNEYCNNYKDSLRKEDTFDVNGNGSTTDIVDYSKKGISFVGPTSLLTTETASDYNEEGEEIKTTIAPRIAEIDKLQNNRTAKIGVQILNNYSGNISGVKVIGKTTFEGNTSQILGKDLGSTFTAEMTGPIELPEKLQGVAKVYYSENEIVNNDINDSSNKWKTEEQVTDFRRIRSYAIDLGDYVIAKGEEYICTYEIEVPQDVNYNDVTYSTHAVYFYLETDEGKLKDQTETSKLGFMIARKYDLEVVKKQKGNDYLVEGATYKVTEEGKDNSKIAKTNSEGKLEIKDLFVEKIYEIEEIRSPEGYELNENVIKFKASVDQKGDIQVEKLEGETKTDFAVNNQTISVIVEDVPLSTLKILKQDTEGEALENIRFEITGNGYSNRAMITNSKGIATISNLYLNEEYIIRESSADGYYIPDGIFKFIINESNGDYNLKIIEDSLNVLEVINEKTENNQPSFQIKLQNEKIPTYNIEIAKEDKNTNEPLANAQFSLKSLDNNEEKYFTTDERGLINVENLYQYVEGKDFLGEYELKEITAPEGYITDSNIYKFRCEMINDELTLKFLTENKFDYTIEGDKVKISFKNAPIFKLTKKDGDTQELLPNTKFAIYKIDEKYNEYPAYDVRGNLVGEQKEINGQKYQVVVTDDNGEISLNLPQGLYKVVEVEALEDYQLPEKIEDRSYYFGIDKTIQATKEWSIEKYTANSDFDEFDITKNNDFIGIGSSSVYNVNSGVYLNALKITKMNQSKEIIWERTICGDEYISAIGVKSAPDNSIIIAISTTSKELSEYIDSGETKILTETGIDTDKKSAILIKLDSEGNYVDSITLKGYLYGVFDFTDINSNGDFAVSLEFDSDAIEVAKDHAVNGEEIIIDGDGTNNSRDVAIMYLNNDFKIEWSYGLEIQANNWCGGLSIDENGDVILGGTYWYAYTFPAEDTVDNEDLKITPNGAYDLMFLRFSKEGKIQYANSIGGSARDYATKIVKIKDDGYIATGYSAGSITIPAEETVKQEEIVLDSPASNSYRGIVIKFTEDNKVEWAFDLGQIYNFLDCEEYDGQYVVYGTRYSPYDEFEISGESTESGEPIKVEQNAKGVILFLNEDGKIIRTVESFETSLYGIERLDNEFYLNNGFLYKLYLKDILPSVPNRQSLIVDNYKKQFNIYTSVEGIGGTISGLNRFPYEKVAIHESNKKDIIISPNEGYKIFKITINDKEIAYDTRDDGTVLLEKFNDMTEDKYIVATFVPEDILFEINKVNEKGEKLTGAEFKITSKADDDPSIGENAIGELIDTGIEDYYEFVKEGEQYRPANIDISNSVAMSGILVDLTSGDDWYKITINAEIDANNNYGDQAFAYISNLSDYSQQDIFDLKGKHESEDYSVLVKGGSMYVLALAYANYEDSPSDNFVINSIKVEQTEYSQNVISDSNGEIKLLLTPGEYKIKETKAPEGYLLNKEEMSFTVGGESNSLNIVNKKGAKVIVHHYKDGTTEKLAEDETLTGEIGTNYTALPKEIEGYEVVIDKMPERASGTYTEETLEVNYYYKEIPAKLIVHHYLEGTEEIVPGTESFQINEEKEKDSEYTTSQVEGIDAKYELVAIPNNATGIITQNETVVTYYYRVKDSAGVIVHHIDADTKKKIAEDDVISGGKYGDSYTTSESNQIPANYKFVSKTDNWEGTMIDSLTEVTYEYKKDDVTFEEQVIDKTGTDKVINKDDIFEYNISYSGKINNYIGRAQVVIVDTLPYEIDESKSVLDGGTYDEENQTITWVELIDDINTYEDESEGQISINKNIKLVFRGVDYNAESIENNVVGNIKLLDSKEESEEVTDKVRTETDFKVDITVSKVWEDNENIYERRPQEINVNVYNGADLVSSINLSEENSWRSTIENLPKYKDNGDEIDYKVEEQEVNEKDLYYYETEIGDITETGNEKEITITNKMTSVPGQVVVKYIDKNTGLEIATEVVKEDKVGAEFDVTEDKKEIEGYTLIEEPEVKSGTYTEETQEKVYYYAKNISVHVTYLDKLTNEEIAEDETIAGYEGKSYDTVKKTIDNYTYVEDSGNTFGSMGGSIIEVKYYYLYNAKVKVEHIDKITDEVLDEEVYTGLEGDTCETNSKEFEGYILVEEPEEKTVTMTKDEIIIKYYYAHISAGVLEKHISEVTGEVLYEELHEGKEGDEYTTSEREFEGYELVMSKYPANADGYMSKDLIEVIYYYKIKPVNIIKNEVSKTGTASIDERTDKVTYNIVYEGVIDTYRGEVVVYLEDTLPYDIDVEESNLDGGTYDEETNTIKWYENVGEIDTLETGENVPATIRVEKTIEVLYKDIDIYQDSMINEIKGVMYLPADNKTVEDESEFETEIAVKGEVVVKYVDKNTNEEISSRVEKRGRVGTEYDVTEDEKEIEGYTLVEEPAVKTGTYTEESQEKIYYYAKNTDVHVRYVDKISKEEIAEEELIEGYEGQKYATDKKEIEGYTFVEDSGNTEGEMRRERTEVVYYYLYKTKVRVEHRDKYTDGLLGEEEQEGLEGEVYESSPKDFEGYVLVEEPENRTVTMTKEEIVLIYYYSYISGGVIEKHIDEITGEILDEEVYEGKEGDPYSTKEKEFRGYDLVEEKYPANSSGEMTRDVIEVKYYYIKRATVRVEYIDKVNDEKLTEDVIINGHENDKYRTEEKEFEGYDLVEIPENATGEMKITVNEDGTYNAEIVVTYYYKYVSAGIVEKHIDEITGEVLTEERYTGYEGDKYETKEKEFAGYDLVKEKYPENATGVMTREEIEVDYYYIKKATVRVEYVDKYTGNKIIEDVIISGHEKEEYKTEEKEFEGYDYIEVVGETEGTMTPDEEKVITYYYLKPATVITRYLEEETEEVLAPEDIVEGHEGDEYVTGAKEIEYYKISKLPENATGEMKDTIYVTYYYKKKIVDLSLDKTIDSMEVEGKKQRITNEDLVKAEVYRKSINSTDIKIVFNIKVTNEGEIEGKAEIVEKIPEYLSMSEKDNPGWTVEGEEARYETETIEAGKSKTYKVVMRWEKGDGHFGMQKNIAKIEKVITPSGFDEENLQNNSDESEVMITISTGVEKMSGIILIALLYILAIVYMNRKLILSKVEIEDTKEDR